MKRSWCSEVAPSRRRWGDGDRRGRAALGMAASSRRVRFYSVPRNAWGRFTGGVGCGSRCGRVPALRRRACGRSGAGPAGHGTRVRLAAVLGAGDRGCASGEARPRATSPRLGERRVPSPPGVRSWRVFASPDETRRCQGASPEIPDPLCERALSGRRESVSYGRSVSASAFRSAIN